MLAEDVLAPLNLPPFHSSAMDGYALRLEDRVPEPGSSLRLVGESLAGHPYPGRMGNDECIRITTGAALPACADTVVIQENCEIFGDRIRLIQVPDRGANIRLVGHDVRMGDTIGHRGKRLSPLDSGWLAACGLTDVPVYCLPRVAVFSTGDELVPPGGRLEEGRIYDANRSVLLALLSRLPVAVTDLGILPDDTAAIEAALTDAAEDHQLLLTSGGVSVGDADYVKDIVERLGSIELWRINLKPGKPLAFGKLARALFLGLPGNPVSTIVTCLLVAKPLLLALAGARPQEPMHFRARLAVDIPHRPGRTEYQRGICESHGVEIVVRTTGDQSSNRLATFSGANCLIRIPKEAADLKAGSSVEVLPFEGLIG